jgi:transposase
MKKDPPLPKEIWDLAPPVVQAAVWALVEGLERRIAELAQEVVELKARLNQNSRNSSWPPSSDGAEVKRTPPREPSGRKRGGQPGHEQHKRSLVPAERVNKTEEYKPQECRRCGGGLRGEDSQPYRHQVIEVLPIEPYVSEYRLHRLLCERCGVWTRAPLPPGVPRGSFGPRLQSIVALCTGAYRMSKRMVVSFLADVLGVEISLGEVCQVEQTVAQALDPPVQQARVYVQSQAANVNETTWWEQGRRGWLWVAVTSWVSVFFIRLSRGAKVLREIVGEGYREVLSSDRAKAYNRQPLRWRQICWAHLRRDFQAMVDRGGAGANIGRQLLEYTEVLFGWWYRVRDGTWARSTFKSYVSFLRGLVRQELKAGAQCACPKTAGTCRELLQVEPALWTFVRVEGIEPTNNAAERALRHAVQWRKTSYGTDSPAGSHFVENLLTVVATCRQRGRPVLDYLTACCQAFYEGHVSPSLLPATPTALPISKVS